MPKKFLPLAQNRRSAHSFAPGFTVTDQLFLDLLEPVRFTPSGYNAQPWEFLLIREKDNLTKIHEIAYKQDHILEAGNLVVVLGNIEFGVVECERIVDEWKNFRGFSSQQGEALRASLTKDRPDWKKREMVIRNCSLAVMSFLLSVEAAGLAACPMMGFRQLDLRKHLGLPADRLPVLLIAVGKPGADEPVQLPRKTAQALAWKERFGERFE